MVNEEGEIQPQKPEEEVEPKAPKRNRKKAQTQATEFPATTRINEYGFLHFKKRWLEELGWTKGMELKADRTPDGSLTLSKA
jgi:hypothetical protein